MAQIIGTVLLTGFIVLQAITQTDSQDKNTEKQSTKTQITFFVLCLIIFFLNGLTGVIVLSALVSFFAFKEKLTAKEWIFIGGAFVATVLFAF